MVNTADTTATPPSGPDVTDSAIATTLLDQEPTIAVAKSSHVETLGDGTFSTTYLIDVENTGNTTLTAIQVEDDLAAVFGVGTFTVISVSSADLTLDAAYDGHIDTNVLSGTDSLAPGETGAVTLVVLVDPNGEPGPFTNTASVSGGTFDVLASAVGQAQATFDVAFDLSITIVTPSSVAPDENHGWTLDIVNDGPSVAPGPITATTNLGVGLTYVSATGAGWSCTHASGTVTCVHAADMVAGAESTIALVTGVQAALGSTIAIDAVVGSAEPASESNTANSDDTASATVDSLPVTGIDATALVFIAVAQLLLGAVLLALSSGRRGRRSGTVAA